MERKSLHTANISVLSTSMVYIDFIAHALQQPADQIQNHSSEIQQHATLIPNSLGGEKKEYSVGTQPQCPHLLMTQINPVKFILLYYAKILICKVRVIYEADRDPVMNSTDRGKCCCWWISCGNRSLKTKTKFKKCKASSRNSIPFTRICISTLITSPSNSAFL